MVGKLRPGEIDVFLVIYKLNCNLGLPFPDLLLFLLNKITFIVLENSECIAEYWFLQLRVETCTELANIYLGFLYNQ